MKMSKNSTPSSIHPISKILLTGLIVMLVSTLSFAQANWTLTKAVSQNLSASVYIPGLESVAFIHGTAIHYHATGNGESFDSDFTSLSGFPSDWSGITAAAQWDAENIMLFNDHQYVLLQLGGEDLSFTEASLFPGLPEHWGGRLDAVVNWGGENLLFIAADQFVLYDMVNKTFGEVALISEWVGWPGNWEVLDAVASIGDGFIYFYSQGQYLSYDINAQQFTGNPKAMNKAGKLGLPPSAPISQNAIPVNNLAETTSQTSNPTVTKKANPVEPQNSIDTDGWCLTGTPDGASDADLVEDFFDIEKGGKGTSFEDQLPQGARVAEIRVWGSWVILGLQTVIQTADGSLIELPVLGSKKGKTSVFKLQTDECITGLVGTHVGDAGNFVHTIKFVTNKRKSKNFGNARGLRPFKINIPNGSSFFGFNVKENNYLTNVGVKFVAYEGNYERPATASSSTATADNGVKANAGEWSDDMEDYQPVIMDMQFASADGLKALPSSEWLGRGIDILALDPLNITDIAPQYRRASPITLVLSSYPGGEENKNLLYHGTDYDGYGIGKTDKSESWIQSSRELMSRFKASLGVSVGTKLGGGSMSASYGEINSTKVGSEEIYYSQTHKRKTSNIRLVEKWRDPKSGKKHRQLLSFDFRALVDNLPVVSSVPSVNAQKGKALPSQLERIRKEYETVIQKFGTHYSKNVTFGGTYVSMTKIKKTDYTSSRQTEADFKLSVEAQIKAVTLGVDVGFEYGSSDKDSKSTKKLETRSYVQGASGQLEYNSWDQNLADKPVPIEVLLTPNYELLTDVFFPNDKEIAKKRAILKLITEQYQLDNDVPPFEPNGVFFTENKASEHDYILTVKSIKCTQIDNDEPGSTNEVYGNLNAVFVGTKTGSKTFWDKKEGYAKDIPENGEIPIQQTLTIRAKPSDTNFFQFMVTLVEDDDNTWGGKDDLLGVKIEMFPTKDFKDNIEDGVLKFENDGDHFEVGYSLEKREVWD